MACSHLSCQHNILSAWCSGFMGQETADNSTFSIHHFVLDVHHGYRMLIHMMATFRFYYSIVVTIQMLLNGELSVYIRIMTSILDS